MNSIERVTNTLALKPVDRVPAAVTPWPETIDRWIEQGHVKAGEDIGEVFEQDIRKAGRLDYDADLDFEEVILEETEDTILKLDANGAKLRWHKKHSGTPEHVDFTVKENNAWLEHVKPHLVEVDRRRIPFQDYRDAKAFAAGHQRFFCWDGPAPFEQMHRVCGHEHVLMGMGDDPDWVKDMVMTYTDLIINHLEALYAEEGRPDGMYIYEDMGFKFKPFMSPAMYKEIMQPGHRKLFDFAHAQGCKVIVHSCGFVEPLVPGLIEAGMDCLQAMEVKAGMDMPRLFQMFGDKIAFYGNIDTRVLISNDLDAIEKELLQKIPPVINNGGGYILHSDHSEPADVDFETMQYFIKRGRQIGTPT
jgi:uroporphyrinogen decarboxylase